MDRHHLHRVRGRECAVLRSFRIVVRSLVEQEVEEGLVLLIRLAVEVDVLEVGNDLAELTQVVIDDLTIGTRNLLLPEPQLLQKVEEGPLQGVYSPKGCGRPLPTV